MQVYFNPKTKTLAVGVFFVFVDNKIILLLDTGEEFIDITNKWLINWEHIGRF